MKQEDYERVLLLRKAGHSYARIAVEFGVPKNSVKSFCSRFDIRLDGERVRVAESDVFHCRQCGRSLEQNALHKAKRFCSDACRQRWWNAHRYHGKSKLSRLTVCAHCGRLFRSYAGERRRYCCHPCYIADRFGGART